MDLLLVDLKQKQPGLGKHVEVVEGEDDDEHGDDDDGHEDDEQGDDDEC